MMHGIEMRPNMSDRVDRKVSKLFELVERLNEKRLTERANSSDV